MSRKQAGSGPVDARTGDVARLTGCASRRGAVVFKLARYCLLAGLAAIVSPITAYGQAPARDETAEQAAQRDLELQWRILSDPGSTAQQRQEAARRLVSRSNPDADEILLRVISDFSNVEGQLAVARALSTDPTPNPRFVEPLVNILGGDRELTAAAASALAAFNQNEAARERLLRFADDLTQPAASRAAVVLAMGRLVDKRTAGALVSLLTRENENSLVRDAAADALIEMTGQTGYGRDAQQWSLWWQRNREKSELQWATDLLNLNAARSGELYRRVVQVRDFASRLMREEYLNPALPEAERTRKLISHLESESMDVRAAAVQVVYDEAVQFGGTRIPGPVLEALRRMVGDSSSEVRVRVAKTLTTANDPGAVDALLAQLSQERDPEVEAAILSALGPSRDLRSVEALLSRLGDTATPYSVARAAAEALRDMAPVLREPGNALLLNRVAQQLRARLRDTTTASAAKLRESIVEAMSRLGERSLLPVFYELLDPRHESARIRILALRGLGLIGDAESANMIVNNLNDDQQGVRLAAAEALLTTASLAHAEAIAYRLTESVERDPDVRAAAWKVLSAIFEKASVNELLLWAERFKGPSEEDLLRRLRVLGLAELRLEEAKDQTRLAAVRQNLGETLLRLASLRSDPATAEQAAGKLKLALDYWTQQGEPEAVVNLPRQQYVQAMLRARRFEQAAAFATQLISANPSAAPDMWVSLSREIRRLRENRDLDGALALIEAAKSIPWGQLYSSQLKLLEDQTRRDRGSGGQRFVRDGSWLDGGLWEGWVAA